MNIKVPLGELSRKMSAISSVVPGKTTMPILSMVLVSADSDGIYFSATDLDISVTSKIKGEVKEGGRVTVPAKKVNEIVKSLSGEEVEIKAAEEKITITCSQSRFIVNGRSAEDFPRIPQQERKNSFSIAPELLEKLVDKTVYSVSTDMTRPQLCGVLWELSKNGLSMISTDGHRLSKVDVKLDLGDIQAAKVIVPPKALHAIKTYAEGEEAIDVCIGENSISFDMEESSIYSRLLEGPFPDYEKVIPKKNEKELVVSTKKLADATKRVSILSDALTRQVIFSLDRNRLTLHVSTQELGEAREEVEANFLSEPMDIGYNAGYILDILRTIDEDEITMLLDRPDNAGMLEPKTGSGEIKQMCIVMPLRII